VSSFLSIVNNSWAISTARETCFSVLLIDNKSSANNNINFLAFLKNVCDVNGKNLISGIYTKNTPFCHFIHAMKFLLYIDFS